MWAYYSLLQKADHNLKDNSSKKKNRTFWITKRERGWRKLRAEGPHSQAFCHLLLPELACDFGLYEILEWRTKNCVWLFKDDIKVRFAAIFLIKLTFSLLVSGALSNFSCLCWALLAVPRHGCVTLDMTAVKGAMWKALWELPAPGSGAALSSGLAGEPVHGWSWSGPLTCWLHFWMHLSVSLGVCLSHWAGTVPGPFSGAGRLCLWGAAHPCFSLALRSFSAGNPYLC